MSLRHLHMLRHGQTEWNASRRMQGYSDVPLNPTGIAQADAAAPYVARLGFTRIISSDLQRAIQTAEPVSTILDGMPIEQDRRLREANHGDWEGLGNEEIIRTWPDQWAAHSQYLTQAPHGESAKNVAMRVLPLIDELLDGPDESVLFVTHGGTIKALVHALLQVPDVGPRIEGPGNCHWSTMSLASDGWVLTRYNVGVLGD